jgi:hypothetical protein
MAALQKYFNVFHDGDKPKYVGIKLGRFDEEETLRDKRRIVREKLLANLPAVFEKYKEKNLVPTFRDQGSYDMNTGIKPLEGDFDIDQGVYFDVPTTDYSDPVVLKERVYEALNGHTKRVEIRRPCVTVFYQDGYHVDLAIYSGASANSDGKDYLAMGKTGSEDKYRVWQESDPTKLKEKLFKRFDNDETGRKQYRRIIRFMKRWKDVNFLSTGHNAPRGIGLTINTHDYFTPNYDTISLQLDDLTAMHDLTVALLGSFEGTFVLADFKWVRRLKAKLLVTPFNDVHEKMTAKQMEVFETKLTELRDALNDAMKEVDVRKACQLLRNVFGDDFPVPDESATARVTPLPVASHSQSA